MYIIFHAKASRVAKDLVYSIDGRNHTWVLALENWTRDRSPTYPFLVVLNKTIPVVYYVMIESSEAHFRAKTLE